MGWLSKLDPTGNDFLGLGPKGGRVAGGVLTGGWEELARPDPFGASRHTTFAKSIGGFTTGAATGAAVGFATGGPFGAAVGAVVGGTGGAVAGGTGATKNYTPLGFLKNVGIGVGGGLVGGGAAAATGHIAAGSPYLFAPKIAAPLALPSAASTPAGAIAGQVVEKAGTTSAFGGLGTTIAQTAGLAVLSKVIQGNPILGGTSPGTTGISVTGTGPGEPTQTPATPPPLYPGVPQTLQTVGPAGGGEAAGLLSNAPSGVNWLFVAVVVLFGLFFFGKRLRL